MPGAVPKTSTLALTNATLPYALEIADKGIKTALNDNIPLSKGLNIHNGILTNENVAKAFGVDWSDLRI